MKLVIKQKVFSWKDKFNVMDIMGNTKYRVEGDFSLIKKLRIFDLNDNEVIFIKQKFSFLKYRFSILQGENQIAEIVKEFSFFTQKYTIEGLQWEVEGNFFGHNYVIKEKGLPIATIKKELFSWGDSYALEISDGVNEVLALSVVIAIDCVLSSSNNSD